MKRPTEIWPGSRLLSLPGRHTVAAAALLLFITLIVLAPQPSFGLGSDPEPTDEVALQALAPDESATLTATPAPRTVNRLELVTPTPSPVPEFVTRVSREEGVNANELGRIPILMYHAFVHNEENTDEWTITFDELRAQLDWLYENDFVAVGLNGVLDREFNVPAGKRPVILTFDDASAGQFGLQKAPGGGYEVRPDTAVGVLEEYRQAYPGFIETAFFAVLPYNCFASEDDPSTCEERLTWLIEHDYEIGNHTYDHVDMTDVSPEFFTESIGSMKNWINERIPQGPGNLSEVLVMPFGAFPDWDLHPDQRSWLAEGFWYLGEPVNLDLVLAVNGGPAISPYSVSFFPAETYRIASEPGVLAYWQEQIASGATPVFVSDGNPETVTVPASYQDEVDTEKLDHKGLQLRVYEDE